MVGVIASLLLSTIPYSPVIEDRVTVYELNHFYDDDGNQVFTQRIWYDDDGMVIDWRMAKRDAVKLRNGWLFFDKDGFRKVSATSEIETWSQIDYELHARTILPQTQRRELSKRP